MRSRALEALRATFRPEFLNRIDDIILFQPLGAEALGRIVELQLIHVSKLLAERHITIELTQAARELLYREGLDPAYGARPLKRAIQRLVQDPLAMQILEGTVRPGNHVVVDAPRGSEKLTFAIREGQAARTDASGKARKSAA
jgi:ATP-dependent Clp protease ATP-binding subunit ClpB